ncbi:MAG: type II toxin-antitoxin system RelE/ParE family toxin [Saprospiraceae bacterium]
MNLTVQWKSEAIEGFFNIVDYYLENGWNQAALNFRENVDKKIDAIIIFPGGGRPTKIFKNVRYVLIDKHSRMYYMYGEETLTILAFFDARQHLAKALLKDAPILWHPPPQSWIYFRPPQSTRHQPTRCGSHQSAYPMQRVVGFRQFDSWQFSVFSWQLAARGRRRRKNSALITSAL